MATLAYYAALAELLGVTLTWPLDPTPLHYILLSVATSNLAQASAWMNFVCYPR